MQKYVESVKVKKFKGENMKSAYMKCVKWIATNIIADDKLRDLCVYSIAKREEHGEPLIVLDIQVALPKKDADEKHCAICRENHCSFLYNDNIRCDDCKLKAYHRREEGLLLPKLEFVKKLLKEKEV